MRNAYAFHRYRKYRKRLLRRWQDPVALLKWRYWRKLYGKHQVLWGAS